MVLGSKLHSQREQETTGKQTSALSLCLVNNFQLLSCHAICKMTTLKIYFLFKHLPWFVPYYFRNQTMLQECPFNNSFS